MSDILGYKNFCSACKGSKGENGELVCGEKKWKILWLASKASSDGSVHETQKGGHPKC